MVSENIKKTDPEIARVIKAEIERQENTLELIASENIASPAVMDTQGSVLTNKYAEGYPSKRYYGGCEFVDVAENLAIERAKVLFNCEYANVQPHSGSQANMAVYFGLLNIGDTVLGMDLAHGGHLTHGSPVSFSGKLFNFKHYGVKKETGIIDYNLVADIAKKEKPKMIVAGSSSYPRFIDFEAFEKIARSVGAYLMVDMAHIAGLVAASVHPTPIPFAHVVTSTTHKTLRGPRGGIILAKANFGKKLSSTIFPGIQGGPLMHVIAGKAVAFKEAMTESFQNYQRKTVENAKVLAKTLIEKGIDLVSNGTDNHMMLIDLTNLGITGKTAEKALGKAGITVNKNAIPFDKESPSVTSGIRIGTPSLTSRGMGTIEVIDLAGFIETALRSSDDNNLLEKIRLKVSALCKVFPAY